MGTILLMFIVPIGAIFYYHERKNRGKYQAIFDDYIHKVNQDNSLNNEEKLAYVKELFLANRYEIIYHDKEKIVGERKILSMGLLMMGLVFYLFYFFFFQKPHQIQYQIKSPKKEGQ